MKLSFEDKETIYKMHLQGYGYHSIAAIYNVHDTVIEYICVLADKHGLEKLHRSYTVYSKKFKTKAIHRVLIDSEPVWTVATDIGLPSKSILQRWIKSYKDNGYNVVTKKKGRPSTHGKGKEDNRGAGEGERRTSRATTEKNYRERIIKKTASLSSRGRKEGKEQLTKAVTELRQELKCSLDFILDTINTNDSLPNLSKSDYYYWKNRIDPDAKNSDLMDAITAIYTDNHKRYGYRRITLQLKNEGWRVNHKAVKRLMSKLDLYGITPRAKYKSYKGDFNGTVDNMLLYKSVNAKHHTTEYIRDFSTTDVNEKWTTDVSEFHIAAGKLYLSPILDMHNREIVSYNISKSPNYSQITDMLNKAFNKFEDLSNLVFHSDQGWQYQMYQYRKALRERGITQSMSRKGNCLDNSPMESFFGKMKNEMFYGHEYEFQTLEQLQKAMEEYIDYYNNERIQVKLKGLTPCKARNQSLYSF